MEDGFQVFISLPTDDVCTLKGLSEDSRIYQLKSRVELKTGIPGDVQHLYFMNKELYDNCRLDEVKLKAGCIVRVKLDSTWMNLFEACWRGDIYEVFQNGVQYLDEREFQGYNIPLWNRLVVQRATNALFIAAHRGFLGLIIELLNHGAADINGKTRFGRTCLHVAAYQGFVGCVSLLLSEGALCSQIDYNGKTALALASENGHIYCERRLWLYQMSLKTFGGLSKNASEDFRSRNSSESIDSLYGRPHSKNSGKTLRLNANKIHLNETEEKRDLKKMDFHLPRVQFTDDRNITSYKPVPEKEPSPSPFPLAQIAEKYRKEYKSLNSTNLPNMGGVKNSRPHTAPVSTLPNENKQGSGLRNELDIVEEANAVEKTQSDDSNEHARTHDVKTTAKTEDDKDRTDPTNKDPQSTALEESAVSTENDDINKQRPQTSKPYGKRHIDLAISSTRERKTDENETPQESNMVSSTTTNPSVDTTNLNDFYDTYRPRKPAQTFESWLEKKRNQGQLRPNTAHAPERSRMGKTIDPDAFQDWLNKKRRNHYRSYSESSNTSPKKTYISSGMTFEKWLEEKKKMANKESENHVTESHDTGRRARVVLAGKTYEDWLNEKMRQVQSTNKSEEENKKDGTKSGKTFQMWLVEKQNQKQIEIIHKATEEKEKQRQLEMEQYQKYLNPNYRTFEEWLVIKKQEHMLERERAAENESKQNKLSNEEKKKDAELVFGIWLKMKFEEEMKGEEVKYQEMKEKWERKEKQRAALRRAININRFMRKPQNRDEINKESCNGLSLSWG